MKIFRYPGALWRLRSFLGIFVVGLSVALWAPICIVASKLKVKDQTLTWMLRAWNRFLLGIYSVRVEVSGHSEIPVGAPALLVSNHQSLFDIPAIFLAFEGDIRMVAKAELFRIPIFGAAITATGFIPVQRNEDSNRRAASEAILKRIRAGFHIWVAPEGGRNVTMHLRPFKSGSIGMAIQAQVPIQPFVLLNMNEVLPKGSMLARPGQVIRMHRLAPIPTAGLRLDARHALAIEVRKQMQSILDQEAARRAGA